MNIDEIKKLLVRYYDGLTSEDEEKELKRFFIEDEVPDFLEIEKNYFLQLFNMAEPELPQEWEKRLNKAIDEWDRCEQIALSSSKHMRIKWISSAAACLLLLLSVSLYMYQSYESPMLHDTCATPEEAYKETQKALVMFSMTLNKGLTQVQVVHKTTEEIQENIKEQLKHLNTSEQ